jgi:hypothetical protein
MRVRVIASRISAMQSDSRSKATSVADSACQFVAGQHHVGHARHHPVEQVHRQADRARHRAGDDRGDRGRLVASLPGLLRLLDLDFGLGNGSDRFGRYSRSGRGNRPRRQRRDQRFIVVLGDLGTGLQRVGEFGNSVDHGQHGVDQRGIGMAAVGAALGQHVLGGMAQPFEARQIEEAAASLHRVDEAEDGIEARAIPRRQFPGDDLARQSF